jgi:hypothetical protein
LNVERLGTFDFAFVAYGVWRECRTQRGNANSGSVWLLAESLCAALRRIPTRRRSEEIARGLFAAKADEMNRIEEK